MAGFSGPALECNKCDVRYSVVVGTKYILKDGREIDGLKKSNT